MPPSHHTPTNATEPALCFEHRLSWSDKRTIVKEMFSARENFGGALFVTRTVDISIGDPDTHTKSAEFRLTQRFYPASGVMFVEHLNNEPSDPNLYKAIQEIVGRIPARTQSDLRHICICVCIAHLMNFASQLVDLRNQCYLAPEYLMQEMSRYVSEQAATENNSSISKEVLKSCASHLLEARAQLRTAVDVLDSQLGKLGVPLNKHTGRLAARPVYRS